MEKWITVDAFCVRHAEILEELDQLRLRRSETVRLNKEKRKQIYALESCNNQLRKSLNLAMNRIEELEWLLKEKES